MERKSLKKKTNDKDYIIKMVVILIFIIVCSNHNQGNYTLIATYQSYYNKYKYHNYHNI